MSRLIDADKFLDFIKSELKQDRTDEKHLENIICVLENLPTAFDVEKVVEQLEEQISKHDLLFNKYVKDKDKSCSWSISELNKIRGLLEAIDVVKAGGIDEFNKKTNI